MSHPAPMPHGEPQALVEDVFWMLGSVRMAPGVVINRTMVILRHAGELTLINAIRPGDPAVLDALGAVKHIVRIGTHGMDDAWFAEHYGATTWAPEGLPADRMLGPATEQPVPWMKTFRFAHTNTPELAILLDRDAGVLVTCDSVQNWPDTEGCSAMAKVATWAMGFNARPAQIGPPWRKRQTPEGGSLRPDYCALLKMDFDHLVGGHGKPLMGGAKEALRATVEATFQR